MKRKQRDWVCQSTERVAEERSVEPYNFLKLTIILFNLRFSIIYEINYMI